MDEHAVTFSNDGGDDAPSDNSRTDSRCLNEALQSGSFLNLTMRLLAGCEQMAPDVTIAEVEAAARECGLLREFERDQLLAPDLLQTYRVVIEASERAGQAFEVEPDGSIVLLKARSKQKGAPPIKVQVASPLLICGVGYNAAHKDPCLLLKIFSETGVWNELVLPRSDLINSGAVHSRLKKFGLRSADSSALLTLLSVVEPHTKFRTYNHTGWNGDDFVMPNGDVISAETAGPLSRVTFDKDMAYGVGGSKERADEMLKTLEDDPYLVTSIGMALASPLLLDTHIVEPGTYHFYGTSTIGKTTMMCAAMSVVGKGAEQKHGGTVGSWSTTRYAAENKVAKYKDLPVAFDEAQLVNSADDFNHLAYSFANGTSKAAGQGHEGFRVVETFRSIVLSTGESSAKDIIAGDTRLKHTGGVALRVNDVAFEGFQNCRQGFASVREHADYVRANARENFGWHFRAVVRAVVSDRTESIRRIKELMFDSLLPETTPQLARVHERYALFAAVIEFAIEKGILPWRAGTGKTAVTAVFTAWKASRGNAKHSHELNTALECFPNTLFQHRHRITILNGSEAAPPNRLAAKLGQEYFFTSDGLAEAVGGKANVAPFLKHLASGECEHWGLRMEAGRQQVKCPRNRGLPDRAYCIVDKTAPVSDINDAGDAVDADTI